MNQPSRFRQFESIRKLLADLSDAEDLQAEMAAITSSIEALLAHARPRSRIILPTVDRVGLMIAFATGDAQSLRGARYPPQMGFTEWVARTGQTLQFSGPIVRRERKAGHRVTGVAPFQSYLGLPSKKRGRVVAALAIDSPRQHAFDKGVVDLLEPYLHILAVVLDRRDLGLDSIVADVSRLREKTVLVLGKDSGNEFAILVTICDMLSRLGYHPRLLKGFSDIPELSNEEKMRVFADMSKFVIIENSFPAGQIAECKICATNRIVTAMLRQRGKGSSYMVTDYERDYDFMKEFEYEENDAALLKAVEDAAAWAEAKVAERRSYFNESYPWRNEPGGDG